MSISRDQYEELIRDYVNREMEHLDEALEEAGISPADVDQLIGVGHPVKTPMIQRELQEKFNKAVCMDVPPEVVVSQGGAIRGALDQGRGVRKEGEIGVYLEPIRLSERLTKSLGVHAINKETGKPFNNIILPAGSPLPFEATDLFTTGPDAADCDGVIFKVYQCDSEDLNDPDLVVLGDGAGYVLKGFPRMAAGEHQIEVTLRVDESGILHVKAVELVSGVSLTVEIADANLTSKGQQSATATA